EPARNDPPTAIPTQSGSFRFACIISPWAGFAGCGNAVTPMHSPFWIGPRGRKPAPDPQPSRLYVATDAALQEMRPAGPRWSGCASVEIELAQRLHIGCILGLAQRLGKLLFQQIGLVLLRVHALPEDRLLAFVLLAHGLGRRLQVFEHALARSRRMA